MSLWSVAAKLLEVGANLAIEDAVRRHAEANAGAASPSEDDEVEPCRNVLTAGLRQKPPLNWTDLLEDPGFEEYLFTEQEPAQPREPELPREPAVSAWEWLFPRMRTERLARIETEVRAHQLRCEDMRHRHQIAQDEWLKRKHAVERAAQNFRESLEAGESSAVERYLTAVLRRSEYPGCFFIQHDVACDAPSRTVVVGVALPRQDEVPDIVGYKVNARTEESKPITLKKREHSALYDSVIKQIVLRTMYEVFESVHVSTFDAVVVNGWVEAVDPGTGHNRTSCVISVSAERTSFRMINLARVDPSECIKNLKGLVAGPLSSLAPVKPIMTLNREDRRFVESRPVLSEFDTATNLAEISWEDFEHLVRELFSRIFSGEGVEVRITQASHDQGVDAVVFDPDPIRGGKFVIQAKRYTKVVPVSAVRDLYGTMHNEGAAKGFLVTTAHYGRDSREFAKDKPITLIDGPNLVHLLADHGHHVRIDIPAARALRRSP